MVVEALKGIPGKIADSIGVDPDLQMRIGRTFGLLADTTNINLRFDRRFAEIKGRFSRQETPLDFASATFAEFLGLPEDTITANIARVRGTNSEAAHVFLLEWARRVTRDRSVARRLVDSGIRTELKNAKRNGEIEIALEEIANGPRRRALGRKFGVRVD